MTYNKYRELIDVCINGAGVLSRDDCNNHPLDDDIIEVLKKLQQQIDIEDDDYKIYRYNDEIITPLCEKFIEKSIKCLYIFDNRELFKNNEAKTPYGIDNLMKYYNDITEFERILYGSSKYNHEHIIHVFRTWLSGIQCLVRNNGSYIDIIEVREKDPISLNRLEKLSMWTIIALTHDLGYPLNKGKELIYKIQTMVSTFVSISMDLSFHGVQNYMNDFIIRMMSSKMVKISDDSYTARLQSKYYFKFQKYLENTQHGIISALIIYKLLTYFLESDFNMYEDCKFNEEERRQFYIRREILRSIASHTCKDVYHLYLGGLFAFLLKISHDNQLGRN